MGAGAEFPKHHRITLIHECPQPVDNARRNPAKFQTETLPAEAVAHSDANGIRKRAARMISIDWRRSEDRS